MGKNKDVAKRSGTDVAQYDYGEDADAGFQEMTRDDFAIPFLTILQPLSPQLEDDDAAYVEGAKPGMIFNTLTQNLYDGKTDGVVIVPCHRAHHFIEWIPRVQGGGLVEIFEPSDPYVVDAREGQPRFGKIELKNGNELVETFSVFALLIDIETASSEQVMMAFSSTQIKAYKQWMTRASAILVKQTDGRNIRPPLFAHRWHLTTRKQENKKGVWHGWHIAFYAGGAEAARISPDSELYMAARAFRLAAHEFAAESIRRSMQRSEETSEAEDDGAM